MSDKSKKRNAQDIKILGLNSKIVWVLQQLEFSLFMENFTEEKKYASPLYIALREYKTLYNTTPILQSHVKSIIADSQDFRNKFYLCIMPVLNEPVNFTKISECCEILQRNIEDYKFSNITKLIYDPMQLLSHLFGFTYIHINASSNIITRGNFKHIKNIGTLQNSKMFVILETAYDCVLLRPSITSNIIIPKDHTSTKMPLYSAPNLNKNDLLNALEYVKQTIDNYIKPSGITTSSQKYPELSNKLYKLPIYTKFHCFSSLCSISGYCQICHYSQIGFEVCKSCQVYKCMRCIGIDLKDCPSCGREYSNEFRCLRMGFRIALKRTVLRDEKLIF